jgi:transcriptional regulator with XRE-family HTH domain
MVEAVEQNIVAAAPSEQKIEKPHASSGAGGLPLDRLLSRIEEQHPGIESEIGLSSAAMRAGRKVREMRVAKGLTQASLAKTLGWDQVRISNIERGEGVLGPSFDVLQKIAAACDYEIEFKSRLPPSSSRGAEILHGFAKLLADTALLPGTMVPNPQFIADCVSFATSLGTAMQTRVRAVEESTSAPREAAEALRHEIPVMEMEAHGKRMVMLPLFVEESGFKTFSGAELELKLTYPHL